MHPIVIMSYDKSPAINKAVQALEEAGMEVRVLNTAHAKLADFLGALAGVDDDEAAPADLPAPDGDVEPEPEEPEATPPAPEEKPEKKAASKEEPEEEVEIKVKEATINSERVKLQIVEGGVIELFPAARTAGAKTVYSLNESEFAFFPKDTAAPVHSSLVTIDGVSHQLDIVIMPAVQEQVFKIGADVMSTFKE